MRLILISLLTLILGISSAYSYEFKKASECPNVPEHVQALEIRENVASKLSETVESREDGDLFQEEWAKFIGVENPQKFEVDYIEIYKNYPTTAMFMGFKEGCKIAHIILPLDVANKIIELYKTAKRGI